jgi:hypothetical protein
MSQTIKNHYTEMGSSKKRSKQPARNDLLLNHEPAKDATIEHIKIAESDAEVREALPYELLPMARTEHCNEACNYPLEEEQLETQKTAGEPPEGGDSSSSKKISENSKAYQQPVGGFGVAYSGFGSDEASIAQEDVIVPKIPDITANNDIGRRLRRLAIFLPYYHPPQSLS